MRNARSIPLNSIAKFSGSVSPARLANAFDCAGREGFSQYASVSAIGVCTGIGVLRRSKVQTKRDHLNTPIVDSNRRLQVARLLGRLANEMELFNNKSAVYVAALQVDLGNQVGLVGSLGERHWAKGYELGYSRHMPSLAEALATIDRIRPELAALRVVRIGIFGSVARGTSRSNSDVDCLVQLADKGSLFDLISVKQLLEEAFGCPVDVVTPRGLKADVRDAVLGEVRYAA